MIHFRRSLDRVKFGLILRARKHDLRRLSTIRHLQFPAISPAQTPRLSGRQRSVADLPIHLQPLVGPASSFSSLSLGPISPKPSHVEIVCSRPFHLVRRSHFDAFPSTSPTEFLGLFQKCSSNTNGPHFWNDIELSDHTELSSSINREALTQCDDAASAPLMII